MAEPRKYFTEDDVWKGGHYELLIKPKPGSSEALCALLAALWSFPSADGCYLSSEREPFAQERVKPCEHPDTIRLFGVATLPNGATVPCGSTKMDHAGEEGSLPAYWVSFYLPIRGLSLAYPVGAYPFGPIDGVPGWKVSVDSFLAKLADWMFEREPFELALIGFEPTALDAQAVEIRSNGIPEERDNGILWNEGGRLKWYPATRP